MAYTTINKSSDHFNAKLYTGNGSSQAITGVGHQPDLVWIKQRNEVRAHSIFDAVRGVQKQIKSSDNDAESTASSFLTAFGSDGFTYGSSDNGNKSGGTYVSWNWKASGSTASNSNGSITSTVSANTTAGFSIVKYTGTGSNATVGHGLGVAPSWILFKNLDSARNWIVYHKSIGATKNLYLDLNNAANTSSTTFQDTAPTSTVFSIGTSVGVNESGDNIIAYCFAEKAGYSKFGSYTGNGNADGTFVYTGFKPAFVIIKKSSATEYWGILDNKRPGYNLVNKYLSANRTDAEVTYGIADLLSNGFKNRGTGAMFNDSGATYIYMAFAEAPLVGSNNVPAIAG